MDQVHFAIAHLLGAPDGWRSLVRAMVDRWPEAQATELIYSVVTAASEIEATFAAGSPSCDAAAHGWRLAALIGTDLYAMQAIGLPHLHAADLAAYWRIDPYFLDL